MLRVIDESGEDYLYPERFFVPVKLPQIAQDALLAVRGRRQRKVDLGFIPDYAIKLKNGKMKSLTFV